MRQVAKSLSRSLVYSADARAIAFAIEQPARRLAGFRSSAGSVESSSGPTRVWLPEAQAPEGTSLLSGAQQVRFSAN
jgi:hypothetical protein